MCPVRRFANNRDARWSLLSTRARRPRIGLIAQVAAQFDVEDVHLEEPPIEEVIARFYEQHSVET